MKSLRMAATVLFAIVCLMGMAQTTQAAPDPSHPWEWGTTCYTFANDQAAAQAYFDANGQPADLDWNGNGIACEGDGDGDYTPHATASNDPTCGTWGWDQAKAQEYFDTINAASLLDWNGNGIACEDGNDGDFLAWPDATNDGASVWPGIDCSEFPYGVTAAIDYHNAWGGPDSLDPNQDGIACNEGAADPAPDNGPSAWPTKTCYTFPGGWNAAIDYYNEFGGPSSLDADGDGTPCEPNGDDEMVECRDLGGPQHIAQDYFEANGMPDNLDLDGDGLACMNAADGYWGDTEPRPASLPNEDDDATTVDTEPAEDTDASADDTAAADDDDSTAGDATAGATTTTPASSATVSQLPSTGTGTGNGSGTTTSLPIDLLAAGAIVGIIVAALSLRGVRRSI